jgi:hypothetical protein
MKLLLKNQIQVLMSEAIINQPLRKAKLKELLNGYPTQVVQTQIIECIAKIRNVSTKEAQDTKTVYPSEVQEVLKHFK